MSAAALVAAASTYSSVLLLVRITSQLTSVRQDMNVAAVRILYTCIACQIVHKGIVLAV